MWSNVKKEKITKRRDDVKPCKCGYNRWKTISKGTKYMCRKCDEIREVKNDM